MDEIIIKPRNQPQPIEWPLHPLDDLDSFESFRQVGRIEDGRLQVCVSRLAYERMLTHGRTTRSVEVMGVMVGEFVRHGDTRLVFVDGSVRGELAVGTVASVSMSPEAWGRLDEDREARYPGAATVGWYHTHPGWGIFLSEDDRVLHRTFFKREFHTALVLDLSRPDEEKAGTFVWDDGRIVPERGSGFWIFQPRPGFYERLPRLRPNEALLGGQKEDA